MGRCQRGAGALPVQLVDHATCWALRVPEEHASVHNRENDYDMRICAPVGGLIRHDRRDGGANNNERIRRGYLTDCSAAERCSTPTGEDARIRIEGLRSSVAAIAGRVVRELTWCFSTSCTSNGKRGIVKLTASWKKRFMRPGRSLSLTALKSSASASAISECFWRFDRAKIRHTEQILCDQYF
jgi:hypothetical protein